jgi:hypothetical protein
VAKPGPEAKLLAAVGAEQDAGVARPAAEGFAVDEDAVVATLEGEGGSMERDIREPAEADPQAAAGGGGAAAEDDMGTVPVEIYEQVREAMTRCAEIDRSPQCLR